MSRWTDEEVDYLKEKYKVMPFEEIAEKLNRTYSAVRRKSSYLGLSEKKKAWLKSEEAFIMDNYKNMNYAEMAEKLGKSYTSVKAKGKKMGIDKKKYCSDLSLTGQKFNLLLVLGRVYEEQRYWWKCKCDCGNEKLVETNHLKNGMVKSCGCYRNEFMNKVSINEKYGRWTVLEKLPKRSSGGSIMWLCRCDCGTTKSVKGSSLTGGVSKSCGCITREMMKLRTGENNHNYDPNLTMEDRIDRRYILSGDSMSKVRNLVFIRDEYTCHYCKQVGGDLNAHHLNSWNTHVEERFSLENLITLCTVCHISFHKEFGYGNNTKEQFEKFTKFKTIAERGCE